MIYKSKTKVTSKGSILSNEVDRFRIKLPKTPAQVLLGTGTSTCWDIAAFRGVSQIIFVDLSIDVMLAHLYFYRPLFLISETREQFIEGFLGAPRDLTTLPKDTRSADEMVF